MMNGGYLMVSKTDTKLYEKLNNALTSGKPVLFYEDANTCYYIDTITKSGTDIILTKGGKTITIENDGNVTEVGDTQPHLYYHGIDAYKPNENTMQLQIISKSATPLNLETFKEWAESISGVVIIQANGCIVISGTCYSSIAIIKNVNNTYSILYQGANGWLKLDNVDFHDYISYFDDYVNQLF